MIDMMVIIFIILNAFIKHFNTMNQNQSIGMMQGAFFVPKTDLLNWVNSTLQLDVKQIQQLGTGAVYCQIIDVMYPGKVAMARVNWRARNQWQFIGNYKILQQSFAKCKVQKHIDIEKLSKAKYQDNLEFIQWLKRYFDLFNKTDVSTYDAPGARKNAPVDLSFVEMRHPSIKQQPKQNQDSSHNIRKARSPYDNVRSKVNNRSLTLAKPRKEGDYFLQKLSQIKDIIKNAKKEDKLTKIEQILESVQEDLHPKQKDEVMNKIEKSESKKVIGKKGKGKE